MLPVYSASVYLSLPASEIRSLLTGSHDADRVLHCAADTTDGPILSHHHLRDAHRMRLDHIQRIPAARKPSDRAVLQPLRAALLLFL